jgi:hypothetical protein
MVAHCPAKAAITSGGTIQSQTGEALFQGTGEINSRPALKFAANLAHPHRLLQIVNQIDNL